MSVNIFKLVLVRSYDHQIDTVRIKEEFLRTGGSTAGKNGEIISSLQWVRIRGHRIGRKRIKNSVNEGFGRSRIIDNNNEIYNIIFVYLYCL